MRAKAATVLRLAMRRYPKHAWSYTDGLLRVYPRSVVPNDPLDAPLGRIEFHNEGLDVVEYKIGSGRNLCREWPSRFSITGNWSTPAY